VSRLLCVLRCCGWRLVPAFCPAWLRRRWLARESALRLWAACGCPVAFRPLVPAWFWVLEFFLASPSFRASWLARVPPPFSVRLFFSVWAFRWWLLGVLALRLLWPLLCRWL
jgi:hypothetical protein